MNKEWKESKFQIELENALGSSSRWWQFWYLVIKKKPLFLRICIRPSSAEVTVVDVDYIRVGLEEKE